jgi:hypothetical protein
MALNDTPSKLESVFIQRTPANDFYEQINISGSDLIVYHDENGKINADKVSVFATKYGLGSGSASSGSTVSASWASQSLSSSYSVTASYAVTASYSVTASFALNSNPFGYAQVLMLMGG